MGTLKKITERTPKTEFDKKVLSAIQHLQPYVKHRLYVAESTGVFPKNMYHSNGIIDEGIARLYENGYNVDSEPMAIKLHLFEIVDAELDELFENEEFHKKTMSTNDILEEELDSLEELFTVDADNDYVMNEDLADISYHQDNKHKHLFVYDTNESTILTAFEMEDVSPVSTKKLLGKFYSWVPRRSADIVDLYIFGKLNYEEIASIKKLDVSSVEKVLRVVKKGFRKHLD